MTLNAAGDLDRYAWNDRYAARAVCGDGCGMLDDGKSQPVISAKARAHVRETGHEVTVENVRYTRYRAHAEDGHA